MVSMNTTGLLDTSVYAGIFSAVGDNAIDAPHFMILRGIKMRDISPPRYTNISVGNSEYDQATDQFKFMVELGLDEEADVQYALYIDAGCTNPDLPTKQRVLDSGTWPDPCTCMDDNGDEMTLTSTSCVQAGLGTARVGPSSTVLEAFGTVGAPYRDLAQNPESQRCFDDVVPKGQANYYLFLAAQDVLPNYNGLDDKCDLSEVPALFSGVNCTGPVSIECNQERV